MSSTQTELSPFCPANEVDSRWFAYSSPPLLQPENIHPKLHKPTQFHKALEF